MATAGGTETAGGTALAAGKPEADGKGAGVALEEATCGTALAGGVAGTLGGITTTAGGL